MEDKEKLKFLPQIVNIKIDDEFYYEIDLLDFFDRFYRQGYGFVKQRKFNKEKSKND